LLEVYLVAMSLDESVRSAAHSRDVTAGEIAVVHSQLVSARNRYWAHVRRHQCWKWKSDPEQAGPERR
jgi:hypothetical protein